MQDQIASLKSEVMFLRGEVKEKPNSLNKKKIIIITILLIEIIVAITIMKTVF